MELLLSHLQICYAYLKCNFKLTKKNYQLIKTTTRIKRKLSDIKEEEIRVVFKFLRIAPRKKTKSSEEKCVGVASMRGSR